MTLRPLASLILALAATAAHAQTAAPAPLVLAPQATGQATVLPIRDVESDQIQAFLLLEFPQDSASPLDRLLGQPRSGIGAGIQIPLAPTRRVSAQLALSPQLPLGLLCQGRGVTATLGSLAEHCLLAGNAATPGSRLSLRQPSARADLRLRSESSNITGSIGLDRYTLNPSLSLPGSVLGAASNLQDSIAAIDIDQAELGLTGEFRIGHEGWLSIGGTWAHARVVSATELPGALPPQWNNLSLSLGAGRGNFGGELVGRSLDAPGHAGSYDTLGIGVTWRTPWRAQLSVGAENLVSRGKNPFATDESKDGKADEGRVPYLRYKQDL
ncbi:MAG TPA: hypothetical protein VFY12_08885 [Arenimonas sp.]|nr:hypothetical protein [Arenimonas sp.]